MSGYDDVTGNPRNPAASQPMPIVQASSPPQLPGPWRANEQVLVQLGEIGCTQHWLIIPAGTFPLAGAQFLAMDHTRIERRIPGWAIVFAVIGALFFLLGLLFLLAKEEYMVGYVDVTVQGPGYYHQTQLPARSAQDIASIQQWVGYARNLAAAA